MSSLTEDKTGSCYQITVKGESVSFSKSVPEDIAGAIMALAMGAPIDKLHQAEPDKENSGVLKGRREKVSVVEYLGKAKPKSHQETILVFGMFSHDQLENESISKKEIDLLFRQAHLLKPKNLGRDIREVLKKGWLASDISADEGLYVTQTGRKVIEQRTQNNKE